MPVCLPRNVFVYPVRVPDGFFFDASAVHTKGCGSRICTQGTKIWGMRNFFPPENAPPPPPHCTPQSRASASTCSESPWTDGCAFPPPFPPPAPARRVACGTGGNRSGEWQKDRRRGGQMNEVSSVLSGE